MNNKNIIKLCIIITLITILIFIFYLIFIKPHVVGTYTATVKDCKKSYNCTCVEKNCICTYSKWFIENQLVCPKEKLNSNQIKK